MSDNNETTTEQDSEEDTWNHEGTLTIRADDILMTGSDEVMVCGDDIDITLDVGSQGAPNEHAFVNHMGINVTEDEVHLRVSVADPRNWISVCIRQSNDGRIILTVPHENGDTRHINMTPLGLTSQGVFLLGESEEADKLRARQMAFKRATTTDYDAYHKEMGE